ncbi:glycosyltransferase [Acidithiobacillus sp. YTS05]|uniref:Glycosyltransferase n=1 Tax=Igneacidithiobacillus copahuensis TaxID=2724909 RepID=A0AAE3CJ41_9PROT|nr:glycosyltransferase [Igneacidithiobacillus copahuensis]MBU2787401.1 glycosyltransferase [Igneacidithiobacillus copahuensis]MBU2797420.1 glycosyltransferase [Acidithiobacillus sp. VAN18-2]UTV81908.1 glycosyltransferase [Acidithiobacillus sp. YTS05]
MNKANFYKAFEDRFRGSRDLILSRLQQYQPYVQPLLEYCPNATAVDLGCGRGEWLQLLQQWGFSARGVDQDVDMVNTCKTIGLMAEQGDILEFLSAIPNESVAVVSAFHVAEHLETSLLFDVVTECLRVLRPGGIFILETPNPENLVVGACNFYIDPTHLHPLPPLFSSFLVEYIGFCHQKILRLNSHLNPEKNQCPTLLDVLTGVSPDYAVIAQKKGSAAILNRLNHIFPVEAGFSLHFLANRYQECNYSKETNKPGTTVTEASLISRDLYLDRLWGVNVIGHVSASIGLGTAARNLVSQIVAIGIPVQIFDLDPGLGRGGIELGLPPSVERVTRLEDLRHPINIFVLSPPTIDILLKQHGHSLNVEGRFNAAMVFWELPVIPESWRRSMQALDAVLCASPFIYSAFSFSCPGPLLVDAPVPTPLPAWEKATREDFGLPDKGVIFLSAFEPWSDPKRKNIEGVIQAFCKASDTHPDAWLVIKINGSDTSEIRTILAPYLPLFQSHPRIKVILDAMPYTRALALLDLCDVYISLHRAEGFGLVPFEAMSLGKPVIATAWSGNMAYMNAHVACLVNYSLTEANGSVSVYKASMVSPGVQWAEPSVEEASAWVKFLLENPNERKEIGQRAKEHIARWNRNALESSWPKALIALARQKPLIRKNSRPLEIRDSAGALMVEPVRQISPWLPEARWLPMERRWAEEVLEAQKASSQQFPRVMLNVLLHPSRSAESTVASIEAQWARAELLELPPASENWLAGVNEKLLASDCEWIALLDAGDELAPDAIFRVQQAIATHPERQLIYTDEDSLTADGQHVNPHCKPDFNIDYLRSLPYVGGLLVVKKELFEALGGFDPAADGAEDYDLVLRAWERMGDAGIGHIPAVLYHRLQGGGHSNQSIEEILAASRAALERHLQRLQIAAEVLPGPFPPSTRVRYPLTATPTVSIIIPTRNQLDILQRCVESIIEKTRYPHYEILLVDNDSDDEETRNYLQLLEAQEESLGGRLRVLRHPGAFNFSAMNNRAVEQARGDYLLLLNNDAAALHEDWLDEMVSQALRPEVGIVGAKLLFPDSKIQHAGVILGMKGPAEHSFIGQSAEYRGYYGRAMLTQDLSAVTGACLLIAKELYQQVGALDEEKFQVSYNDIDLCLKVRESGKKIVFTPWAILMHEGSASQRGEVEKKPSPEKEKRFAGERMAFYRKWLPQIASDPAYNRQLSLASTDFLIESEAALTWDPDWRPRPRILVHPADREGCGEYRIIAPMRALNRAGWTQGWETMRIFEPAEMERMQPDSIVLQRQMEWPQIEALERHKALSRAFRVFEIDDLITNLPVKSLHKAHIHKDIAKRFRKAAGLCNRLVVATEPLAQAYKGFSDEVRVQSNCIEDAVWGSLQAQRRGNDKPRVGWAGGVGHTGDLEMVADVVRDLAEEVDWIFFGLCPDALKPYVREFHTGVPLPQYPAKLASLDLDLAIAPLEDNPFNEAKSHLRLLEYGILGYPVVCSDVHPYQGDFPVVRVSNRYRDWMKAIREAIADRQALAEMGDRLREQVRAHWLLENRLDDWLAAWLP